MGRTAGGAGIIRFAGHRLLGDVDPEPVFVVVAFQRRTEPVPVGGGAGERAQEAQFEGNPDDHPPVWSSKPIDPTTGVAAERPQAWSSLQ